MIYGFTILGDLDHRLVFVGADATVTHDERPLAGSIYTFGYGEAVAVGFDLRDYGSHADSLVGQGKLVAFADTEVNENGLTIVRGVRLFQSAYGSAQRCALWRPQQAWRLPADARQWAVRALLASVTADAGPGRIVPADVRPQGKGKPLMVELHGEIVIGTAALVARQLQQAAKEERGVLLDVDSVGGNAAEGADIYQHICAHAYRVTARTTRAQSAAAVAVLAADHRVIVPDGVMMLHRAHISGDDMRAEEMARAIARLSAVDADHASIVACRAGVDIEVAAEWISNETYFNAGQAVTAGLAHAVDTHAVPAASAPRRVRFAPIEVA